MQIISRIALVALFAFSMNVMFGQGQADFKINLEKKGDVIEFKCQTGCDWSEITMNYSDDNTPLSLTNHGEQAAIALSTVVGNNSTKFIFTATPTTDGLTFRSQKGTSWTELNQTFKPGVIYVLDQNGIESL